MVSGGFQAERVLSFIPPDGNFRLISYHINTQSTVAIPVYVRHNLSIKTGEQARLDLTVGPKQTLGRTVEGEFNNYLTDQKLFG